MREQTASVVESRKASQRNGIKSVLASDATSRWVSIFYILYYDIYERALILRDSNNQKTTMVVRLHPGQSRRLSAFMDYKVTTFAWIELF